MHIGTRNKIAIIVFVPVTRVHAAFSVFLPLWVVQAPPAVVYEVDLNVPVVLLVPTTDFLILRYSVNDIKNQLD